MYNTFEGEWNLSVNNEFSVHGIPGRGIGTSWILLGGQNSNINELVPVTMDLKRPSPYLIYSNTR